MEWWMVPDLLQQQIIEYTICHIKKNDGGIAYMKFHAVGIAQKKSYLAVQWDDSLNLQSIVIN